MAESKTSPRRLKSKERQLQALELRKAGATFQQIADKLDYKSPQAAFDAVDRALKKIIQPPTEEVRKLEIERLDGALLAIWSKVKAGDVGAIYAMINIMNRRAKLLGLDMPIAVDFNDRSKLPPAELTDQELVDIIEHGRILAHGNGHKDNTSVFKN